MTVQIIRRALYTLAAGLGGVYLIIGGVTRFSPEAITVDLAAFIQVTGPLLIALVCSAGVMEIALESTGRSDTTANHRTVRSRS
jgi:hypothetical protein